MSSSTMGNPTDREQPRIPLSIEEAYFHWLYDQVFEVWNPRSPESFTTVCWLMNQVVFTPLVPYDENRIADAAELRNQFQQYAGSLGPEEISAVMLPDASVFEVLIALAGKADFMVPLSVRTWFRVFIENLKLDKYSDQYCQARSTWPIERTINIFNNRSYTPFGKGGIFPMRNPEHDQRKVELWYQMGAYMTENAMY